MTFIETIKTYVRKTIRSMEITLRIIHFATEKVIRHFYSDEASVRAAARNLGSVQFQAVLPCCFNVLLRLQIECF